MTEKELRRYSKVVVDGVEHAPSRAMLRAVGFEDEDFARPQVGVASTWSMITPCNMHINGLAEKAAAGADAAGGKGVVFNTITVSDGISMGTPGMRYSLVSREIIADSIEAVAGAQPSASIAEAMVLAVYMPPQAPGPGMAVFSTSSSWLSSMRPAARAPTASNTDTMSRRFCPGRIVPP